MHAGPGGWVIHCCGIVFVLHEVADQQGSVRRYYIINSNYRWQPGKQRARLVWPHSWIRLAAGSHAQWSMQTAAYVKHINTVNVTISLIIFGNMSITIY